MRTETGRKRSEWKRERGREGERARARDDGEYLVGGTDD
jgi:hypothetical protein